MVYMLVSQDQKVKKFETIEQAEMYLRRHEGVFYLFKASKSFAGISVIISKDGEIEKVRDVTINSR
jgi:hypothetical protein